MSDSKAKTGTLIWPSGLEKFAGTVNITPSNIARLEHVLYSRFFEDGLGTVEEAVMRPPGCPIIVFRHYQNDSVEERSDVYVDQAQDLGAALAEIIRFYKLKLNSRPARKDGARATLPSFQKSVQRKLAAAH